ncbi:hypothetical protein COEREDRAFT_83991 [Coemansia reversa NRRL 1564]|uniref:WH1-domain-containing protein n=1 Tax=Coemansia reversa (strain ATCC 12441 / NRRL 1564) TaxID=763665 RepID=A0A2G5B0W5_COERN|nr:hypothetical protein COEREDRAFT_83991 [Coemansia reversa NRRL 1564]|eukprot:PIA12644.1 hypothetical protein COEREDRAFT_83991 [Coemansia reversa NRRL 1564]
MPTASLLSSGEKSAIKAAQPSTKHKILAAAIARLFVARPGQSEWKYTGRFGGLVLVKDAHNRASFLRLVNLGDLTGMPLLWEQEIYEGFEFTEQRPFFFTLLGDEHVFGLDFSDSKEAASFAFKVGRRIAKMTGKRASHTAPDTASHAPPPPSLPGRGAKLSGAPTATQRILHLDDAKYRKLVKALAAHNITESMLDDPDTAKFIQKFVSQNGSVDNMIRSVKPSAPTAAPPPPPPPPPPPRRAAPPPPPPRSKGSQGWTPAPPSQKQAPLPPPPPPPNLQMEPRQPPRPLSPQVQQQSPPPPPPPPPPRRMHKPPSPVPHYLSADEPQPLSQQHSSPQAPPMLPPSAPPSAPPLPPPSAPPLPPHIPPLPPQEDPVHSVPEAPSLPSQAPAAPPPAPPMPLPPQAPPPPRQSPPLPDSAAQSPPPVPGGSGGDSRNALLASIRNAGGISSLRKTEKSPSSRASLSSTFPGSRSPDDTSPGAKSSGDLTNALASALAQRSKAIAGDSDSDADDDDW